MSAVGRDRLDFAFERDRSVARCTSVTAKRYT